ncbi:MAG: hypothetical protein IPK94_22840 [Saprospiraceae bacterium]|nr:hypothetical protein [Saprospiraceae bacterium]
MRGNIEFSTPIKPGKVVSKIRLRSQLAKSILFVNSEKKQGQSIWQCGDLFFGERGERKSGRPSWNQAEW